MTATVANKKERLFTKSYIAIMTANFMQMFGFWSTMPLLPFYLEERYACSEGKIGLVLSCYVVAALLFRPFSGYLLDTFRRKPLYLIAYFCFTSIFAGYIACATLTMFIILRLAHGVAFGAQSVGGNTLVVDIMPSSRRGEGLGYYGLTNNIAMSVGPMAGLFMHKNLSYESIFAMSMLVCLVGFFSATLIKPKKKNNTNVSESTVTNRENIPENNGSSRAKESESIGILQTTYVKGVQKKSPLIKLDRFILLRGLPAGLSLLLLSIPYGATTNFVAMYERQMGLGVEPGLYFTFLAVGMGISRLFSGKMVDRGFVTRTICYGLYLAIAAFALLSLCGHIVNISLTAARILFFTVPFIQGVGFGMLFPAYNSLFISLAPHNRRATATSTYLTSWDTGIGIGLVSSGLIAEHSSFSCVYLVGAILCLISTVFFIKHVTPHFTKYRLE